MDYPLPGRLKVFALVFAAGMQQQFLPEPLIKPSRGEFGVLQSCNLQASHRLASLSIRQLNMREPVEVM